MRPLICAEPMLRAPRPEMVAESTLTGPDDWGFAGCGVCAFTATPAASATPRSVDESQRGDDESHRVILVFISRESFVKIRTTDKTRITHRGTETQRLNSDFKTQ